MTNLLTNSKREVIQYLGLVAIWLAAYKSADVFNFFQTYSSLWFLPAGVNLGIALAAPLRFVTAPLLANLLLAVPVICGLMGIEFTTYLDPILHSFRLFLIYAGAGLVIRLLFKLVPPFATLQAQLTILTVTLFAAGVGAATGVSLHVAVGNFPWSVAREIILPWAIGDAIGALIIPPLLVPLLMWIFHTGSKRPPTWNASLLVWQVMVVASAMIVAFWIPQMGPNLGSLWYVILLPPVYFAVRGGLSSAASAIAITALFIPPSATLLGFEGERISLQFLLLIACGFSLMIGAAITDRKQAYLALKASEESLEQQVVERTQELTEAYEFQRHLIRSIGHDLRQPIQALNMMLDGLVIQHRDMPTVEPLRQARVIGKTASGFITKVLDYAKRDAGKIHILTEDFAIQRVLDLVNQTFEQEAKQRGVGLHVQPTNLRMISDPHLLWEALSNLVQNSLRLSQKAQAVTVSVRETESRIIISIEDQIEASTTVNGTAGFGLQIVEQVARLLCADFTMEPKKAQLAFPKSATKPLV